MAVSTIAQEVQPWVKCHGCSRLLYLPKHERNLWVCGECGYHQRLAVSDRLTQLVDPDSFSPLPLEVAAADELGFVDTQPYPDRLTRARVSTGLTEAVVVGQARIGGVRTVVAVMDFRFLGGSLGAATGELIARGVDAAVERGCPFVVVTASGGARMQEGTLSLMQMATVSQALSRHRQAGLLSVSVITDPTFGGVAASFATNVDLVIAERGARMGFAGRRVIAQTVGGELPSDFQTADFLMEHGHVDLVSDRRDLRTVLGRLLALTAPAAGPVEEPPPPRSPDHADRPGSAATVAMARDTRRPTFLDYVAMLVEGFVELHGDRMSGDDPALVTGFGRLRGRAVLVAGHQRGHTTAELASRSFGMPSPAGYRKATRLVRLAGRLGLPVVTLVDTPGAHPGPSSEESGQAGAIAECIQTLGECPTPVVSVVTGEGGSGGALALSTADRVHMLQHAIYSVISPEGCAAILWGTKEAAGTAADALRITADCQRDLGVVDGVIAEPEGGAHTDPYRTAASIGQAVTDSLDECAGLSAEDLHRARRARFRRLASSRVIGGRP